MWIYWPALAIFIALIAVTLFAYFMKDPEDDYLDVHPDDEW